MIHFTYQLNDDGQTPKQRIKNTFGNVTLELGKYPKIDQGGNIEKIYGEIDLILDDVPQFEQITQDWQVEILTDQQAIEYLNSVHPLPDEIIQPKIVSRAAQVVSGKVEKIIEVINA